MWVRGLDGHLLPHEGFQSVKCMIKLKLKSPWKHQRLLHGNVQLENSRPVAHYDLKRNTPISLVLSMHGQTPDGSKFAPTCLQAAPETSVNRVYEAATYLALQQGQRHREAAQGLQQCWQRL